MTLWVTQKAKGTPRAMAANGQMEVITLVTCEVRSVIAPTGNVKSIVFIKFPKFF
jgi:hypothetical protein